MKISVDSDDLRPARRIAERRACVIVVMSTPMLTCYWIKPHPSQHAAEMADRFVGCEVWLGGLARLTLRAKILRSHEAVGQLFSFKCRFSAHRMNTS